MIIDAGSKKDKKGLIVDIDIENKKNRVVIYNIYNILKIIINIS